VDKADFQVLLSLHKTTLYDNRRWPSGDFLALPYFYSLPIKTLSTTLIFWDRHINSNELVFAANAQAQNKWLGLIV
jgi:hypothetical protein